MVRNIAAARRPPRANRTSTPSVAADRGGAVAPDLDVNHLPLDSQRVVVDLTEKYDQAYALRVAFTIRTAVELHRGWHMTLLTSKIMHTAERSLRS